MLDSDSNHHAFHRPAVGTTWMSNQKFLRTLQGGGGGGGGWPYELSREPSVIHTFLAERDCHTLSTHKDNNNKSISFVQTLTEPPNVDGGRKYFYILNKKKEEKVGDVYKCYQCDVSVNDFVLAILNFPTHSPKIPQLLSITNPPTL